MLLVTLCSFTVDSLLTYRFVWSNVSVHDCTFSADLTVYNDNGSVFWSGHLSGSCKSATGGFTTPDNSVELQDQKGDTYVCISSELVNVLSEGKITLYELNESFKNSIN